MSLFNIEGEPRIHLLLFMLIIRSGVCHVIRPEGMGGWEGGGGGEEGGRVEEKGERGKGKGKMIEN